MCLNLRPSGKGDSPTLQQSINLPRPISLFDVLPGTTVSRQENKKPTFGLVTEVGYLRFDLSFPYRAISPHCGALLQRQQMQTPILIQWLTGRFYHTAGRGKVNLGNTFAVIRSDTVSDKRLPAQRTGGLYKR